VILFNTLNNRPIKPPPKQERLPCGSLFKELDLIGPLGYPHTWVEAIAGEDSAQPIGAVSVHTLP